MARYIILVIDSLSGSANSNEMAAIDAFNDSLKVNNQLLMAVGIGAPKTATTIDNRDGENIFTSSSINSGSDFYSGFWVIEASDDSKAKEIAALGSRACNRKVELRPLL